MRQELAQAFAAAGMRMRMVKGERVAELAQEMEALRRSGQIADALNGRLSLFAYDLEKALPSAASVLILAAPQPVVMLNFTHGGKAVRAGIPPNFYNRRERETINGLLQNTLAANGYHFAHIPMLPGGTLRLPLKLLAVKSGLCEYGRNNIAYCRGMGSFFWLTAAVTDLPAPREEVWGQALRMAACEHCTACVNSCPQACIREGRRLIEAQYCLTAQDDFGEEFVELSRLHGGLKERRDGGMLVGCLRCQLACPQNRGRFKKRERSRVFDNEETAAMRAGEKISALPKALRAKLHELDFDEYYENGAITRRLRQIIP